MPAVTTSNVLRRGAFDQGGERIAVLRVVGQEEQRLAGQVPLGDGGGTPRVGLGRKILAQGPIEFRRPLRLRHAPGAEPYPGERGQHANGLGVVQSSDHVVHHGSCPRTDRKNLPHGGFTREEGIPFPPVPGSILARPLPAVSQDWTG